MAHTSKYLDYTVSCFIVKKNKVLLIYNDRYYLWLPPGGHIDPDENIEGSIFREIEEETGITKNELGLIDPRKSIPEENIFSDLKGHNIVTPTFSDIHEAGKNHFHIGFRYFLTTASTVKKSRDKHVVRHKWFTKEELDDPRYNLKKHVKFYAKYALKIASHP